MPIDKPIRRFAGLPFLCAGVLGLSTAAFSTAHPARASGLLAAALQVVNCATPALKNATACISGVNTSSGIGVLGSSTTGTGVRGWSNTSVGASGSSQSGYGVYGQSTSGGAGVAGNSPTNGVRGFVSGNGEGVIGGLEGSATSGYGVYGRSDTGTGVGASSQASVALSMDSGGIGIVSQSDLQNAVTAYSGSTQDGMAAVAARGDALAFTAVTPHDGFGLVLSDNHGAVLFYVNGVGDVFYRGTLTSNAATRNGANASAFTPQTTRQTVEDSGSAQLVGGAAAIRLDPTFAASIDAPTGYRIFLTPRGDTRGLYVAAKTAGGFVVREAQAGRTTTSFDYRILGTAFGRAGQRMAVAPLTVLPSIPNEKRSPAPLPTRSR